MPDYTDDVATRAERLAASVPRGVSTRKLFVARAENAELWDTQGRRFIDFSAGIGVLNTGHRHPRVIEAVVRQMETFTHTCFHVAAYDSYAHLAERLHQLTPGTFAKKTLFVTTGAEATENAIKIARSATRRRAVVAFSGGFHGRTLLAMALTGKVSPYKRGFGPFPADVYHAPFPSPYGRITTQHALGELDRLFHVDIDPSDVAAFILEPIQGEGGFNVAPPEFLRELRKISDKHGIVLICDEIQSGIARTGKMFAIEHSDVVPDLITMAKGLGGGFPIAAVSGRHSIMDAAHAGGLGGTFAGSPIGIAAAHAVLDVVAQEELCARAKSIGNTIREHLETMAASIPAIGHLRGIGAMQALELVSDPATRAPDAALTAAVLRLAQDRGLILLSCGASANVIRLLTPLTIPFDILDEGLHILEDVFRQATKTSRAESGAAA